jgi:hypothetical protein
MEAEKVLSARRFFCPEALALTEEAEAKDGLGDNARFRQDAEHNMQVF